MLALELMPENFCAARRGRVGNFETVIQGVLQQGREALWNVVDFRGQVELRFLSF